MKKGNPKAALVQLMPITCRRNRESVTQGL